jgi:hypothetical protein
MSRPVLTASLSLTNHRLHPEVIETLIVEVVRLPDELVAPYSIRSQRSTAAVPIYTSNESVSSRTIRQASHRARARVEPEVNVARQHPAALIAQRGDMTRLPAFLDPACDPEVRVNWRHRTTVTTRLSDHGACMEMVFHFGLNIKIFVPTDSWRKRTLTCDDVRRAAVRALQRAGQRDTELVVVNHLASFENTTEAPENEDLLFRMDL